MTKDEPAFSGCVSVGPSGDVYSSYDVKQEGLTKREYFAAMAMQAIITSKETFDPLPGQSKSEAWAELAVIRADALIKELNK